MNSKRGAQICNNYYHRISSQRTMKNNNKELFGAFMEHKFNLCTISLFTWIIINRFMLHYETQMAEDGDDYYYYYYCEQWANDLTRFVLLITYWTVWAAASKRHECMTRSMINKNNNICWCQMWSISTDIRPVGQFGTVWRIFLTFEW